MSLSKFLKDKIPAIVLNIICSAVLILLLYSLGNPIDILFLILSFWYCILGVFYLFQYLQRKNHYNNLIETAKGLDKRYLISEIIDEPTHSDSIAYYDLLKISSKSMLEEITKIKNQGNDYKDYIEQWVHEIKTPIASIKLLSENDKSPTTRNILKELHKIDNYVEQTLYYARSENIEKDYLIKELNLTPIVNSVIVKNKFSLIQNGFEINISKLEETVYCDSKWVEFILNQIVLNSIKYCTDISPILNIYSDNLPNSICLIIEDNGLGIPNHDLSRVFEKGFTGNNGRSTEKSTGIGLYLCKKLCDKLEIGLYIESEENKYTRVKLIFPKQTFFRE